MISKKNQAEDRVYYKWLADPEDTALFLRFKDELIEWHKTGKEPVSADRDLQVSLDLQEARLKKRGVRKEISFKKFDSENITSRAKVFTHDTYNRGMTVCQAIEQDDYVRESTNEKLYSRTRYGSFYQTIIHGPNENVGEMLYNCPNCGSVSKINTLLEGCPFCNTHFQMGDLFPKVYTTYLLENTAHVEKMRKEMWVFRIIAGLAMLIYGLVYNYWRLKAGEISLALFPVYPIITTVIVGFVGGYFLWALWTVYSTLIKAILVLPLFFGTFGSKRKANAAMRRIDPGLTYEYLESKVLSLVRSIIFSEDESGLVQYSGPALDSRVKDIVDVQYAGIVGVSDYRVTRGADSEQYIEVDVNVYARNFYDNGDRIVAKKEKIMTTLVHKMSGGINTSFSICRIQCKSCGGSFDASKQKRCPYCDSEYHLEEDDFMVTKLEIK